MPTEAATTPSPGRSAAKKSGRRGRSRSPSSYIRKKGKSLKGMLTGEKVKGMRKSSSALSLAQMGGKPLAKALPPATTAEAVPKKEEEVAKEETKEVKQSAEKEVSFKPTKTDSTETTPAVAEGAKGGSGDAETIQIIILLMELQTKQFELLQLEFDPNEALVHDILAQIPKAATEDKLKSQSYAGICSVNGEEMADNVKLKSFVQVENEVKLAIPSGVSGMECSKLAAPILSDKKVHAMLDQLGTAHVALDSLRSMKEMPTEAKDEAAEESKPTASETPGSTSEEPEQPKPEQKNRSVEKIKEVVSNGVEAVSNGVKGLGNKVRELDIEKLTSQSKEALSGKVKDVSNKVRAIDIKQLKSQPKHVGIGVVVLLLSLIMIVVATKMYSGTKSASPEETLKKCGIKDIFKRNKQCSKKSFKFVKDDVLDTPQMEGMEDKKTITNRIMSGKTHDVTNLMSVLN